MDKAIAEIISNITPHVRHSGIFETGIPNLEIIRSNSPTQELQVIHNPAICIILQGKKRLIVGPEVFEYDRLKFLSVSFDLPLSGQILEATESLPYLCLKLDIDISTLSNLVIDMGIDRIKGNNSEPGLRIDELSLNIISPVLRLTSLLNQPDDIKILAPAIQREILYRILLGPSGSHLIKQVIGVGKNQHIARAVAWIKSHFKEPFRAELAAEQANLSISAFHKHFKTTTLMTPLQFQKSLRLQEARRIMLYEKRDAAIAASLVGYESPSQFNREYRRFFGAPPKMDILFLSKNSLITKKNQSKLTTLDK